MPNPKVESGGTDHSGQLHLGSLSPEQRNECPFPGLHKGSDQAVERGGIRQCRHLFGEKERVQGSEGYFIPEQKEPPEHGPEITGKIRKPFAKDQKRWLLALLGEKRVDLASRPDEAVIGAGVLGVLKGH